MNEKRGLLQTEVTSLGVGTVFGRVARETLVSLPSKLQAVE